MPKFGSLALCLAVGALAACGGGGGGDTKRPPAAPIILTTSPVSPARSTDPVVSGTAAAGVSVRIYGGLSCTGNPLATVTAAQDGTFSATVHVERNTFTPLAASVSDASGTSDCGPAIFFVEDETPPAAPTIVSATPAPPSPSTAPTLSGTAEPGATVRIYAEASCAGVPVATVTAGAAGTFSAAATAAANATTHFAATATDALENTSACGSPFDYASDSQPPGDPVLAAVTPAGPASGVNPVVSGTAEPGLELVLYAAQTCTGPSLGEGRVATDGTFQIIATVPANAETTFHGRVTDAAGNGSGCALGPTYVEDSNPPVAWPIEATPPSPSNALTVTFSGTTEPISTVTLFDDRACGHPVLSTTARADGSYELTVVAGLGILQNSTNVFTVMATDDAGNASGCSAPLFWVQDDDPPGAPAIADTSPPSPSRARTPTVSGRAEAGARVRIYADDACTGPVLATVFAGFDRKFSVEVAALAVDATVSLAATATDAAGNTSRCGAPLDYTVDQTAPQDPVFAPLAASLGNGVHPVVSGTAEAGSVIVLYGSAGCTGAPMGTTTVAADGTFQVSADVPPNASTTFHATATDPAWNTSGCVAGPTYVEDSIPPAAPWLIGATPPSPSSALAVTLSGTAEPASTVTLFDDPACGHPVLSTPARVDGTYELTLVAGQGIFRNWANAFTVRATDAAGNASWCSESLAWVQDDDPPGAPAITATTPPSPSRVLTPTASGLAEAGATVRIYADEACAGRVLASAVAGGDRRFSAAVPTLPIDATTSLRATATDAAGNTSRCGSSLDYVVDWTAPPVPVFSQLAQPGPANGVHPVVSGTAEEGSRVVLYGDGACAGPVLGSGMAVNGSFAITGTVSPNAATVFYGTATDVAQNTSGCSAGPVYLEDSTPPSQPALSSALPASPSNALTVTLAGSAEPGSVVSLFDSGSCGGAALAPPVTAAGDGTFTITVPTVLRNTTHAFAVKATDVALNVSSCSVPLAWIQDDTPSAPPAIASASPASPSQSTAPVLSGTAEVGATVKIYAQAGCAGGAVGTGVATGGTFSVPVTVGTNTTTTFTATATDAANNTSACSAGLAFVSDQTPPANPVLNPMSGAPTSDPRPTVAGSAEPNATVRIYVDALCASADPVSVKASATGAFSTAVTVPLNQSTTFGATATDGAGNVSGCTVGPTYLHDSLPPAFGGLVSATGIDAGTVRLTWNAATDAVTPQAQIAYDICVGSTYAQCVDVYTVVTTVVGATTVDISPGYPATRAFFLVRARDLLGNRDANTVRRTAKTFGDGVVATASGAGFTCLLDASGRVECHGDNGYGQLGNAGAGGAVRAIPAALAITAGEQHACALGVDGGVYCWGRNDQGQTGATLANPSLSVPSRVQGPPAIPAAVAVRAGRAHTCALIADGSVRCWGRNDAGQLGGGSTGVASPTPVTVKASASVALGNVTAIAAGEKHTCALNAAGTVQCWGDGAFGQLGATATTSALYPVAFGSSNQWVAVDAGWSHTCAIGAISGKVWCAGLNASGQLGNGNTTNQPSPVQVSIPATRATRLALGRLHTCIIDNFVMPYCWGDNSNGQVGNGLEPLNATTYVAPSVQSYGAGLFAGNDATCHVENGQLSCWGAVGGFSPPASPFTTPLQIGISEADNVTALVAGRNHTCALLADGLTSCFGAGSQGQLGLGSPHVDLSVATSLGAYQFWAIGAGGDDTCASFSDGQGATCWGAGSYGQLAQSTGGTPDKVASDLPGLYVIGVDFPMGIGDHGCAIDDYSSNIQCWGHNDRGQLGFSSGGADATMDSVTPKTVARAVTVGALHSCAIDRLGTVGCWGDNGYGQLGDVGMGASRASYATVPFVANAVEVDAGYGSTTCARLAGGGVVCWGRNDQGQAGIGAAGDPAAPTGVTGLGNTVDIAVGPNHACAVVAGGNVWCWGSNAYGQLGDGTTVAYRAAPVLAQGISNAKQVVVGATHTCALRADGLPLCWGGNSNGQLGDGTATGRGVPALVQGLP
jgi:alpha-tubulin suppressor-like RCC1 family protein